MNDRDDQRAMDRLPKWARERIESQARRVAELTRQVALLSEGPADSDTRVHDYVYPDRPLGKGARIRFTMTGTGSIDVHLSPDGYLEVLGTGDKVSEQALAVQPHDGNTLRIQLARYW